MRVKTVLATIAVCALMPLPASARPAIRNIDYPNGFNTNPLAINDSGVITGSVSDNTDHGHGFIRAADGSFTLFDPPNGTSTVSYAINSAGDTAGTSIVASSGAAECFIRTAAGSFTVFQPASGTNPSCKIFAMNAKGSVAGEETQGRQKYVFYLNAADRESTFLISTSEQSTVTGMNDAGTVVGLTGNAADTAIAGYQRTKAGLVTVFDVPGDTNATYAEGINGKGVIAGSYSDTDNLFHGYVRTANGSFASFDVPDADQTYGQAINTGGAITGYYVKGQVRGGYVRSAGGKITTFAPPDFPSLSPVAINAGGIITGQYYTSQGAQHGFVRTP